MDSQFFDIDDLRDDISQDEKADPSGILAEKYLQLHEQKIESIKQLAGKIPQDGELYFLWTVNSFNAFTFIPFIIKQCGIIEELILSTYSINIRIIEALSRLMDRNLVLHVELFISDSVKSRLPKVYDRLITLTETHSVKVYYAWNHSKIALIRTHDQYFDVEGSGNWGENAQHEQYVFVNSRNVFEFRKNEILHGIHS